MIRVPLGQPLPLNLIIPGGDNGLYPRVTIFDMFMNRVAGPLVLQNVGNGTYAGTYANPPQGQYRAVYTTYRDPAGTMDSRWGRTEEVFDVNSTVQDITAVRDNVSRNSGRAR